MKTLIPIMESEYEGYGLIGGIDWFIWLTKANAEHLGIDPAKLDDEELRDIGVSLDCGNIMLHTETGEYWSIFRDHRIAAKQPNAKFFAGTFSQTIPELGKSANELAAEGVLKPVSVKEINNAPYRIKLSHNPEARYEDLPASRDCPFQGYFYTQEMLNAKTLYVSDKDCA